MSDIASWIDVDVNTGKLTTLAIVDRESPFVIDSRYNITVKAVDESKFHHLSGGRTGSGSANANASCSSCTSCNT